MSLHDSTVQFVGITAFHTQIADPLIGGTYMTVSSTRLRYASRQLITSCSTLSQISVAPGQNPSYCDPSTCSLQPIARSAGTNASRSTASTYARMQQATVW
jgi:hypothetical protein